MQTAPGPQRDVFADHAKRSNLATGANLRPRVNHRGRMLLNLGHTGFSSHRFQRIVVIQPCAIMNVTSASLTTWLFTEQTPLALPTLPRALVNSTSMTSVSPGRTGLRHLTFSAAMK